MSRRRSFLTFTLSALSMGLLLGGCATVGTAGYGGGDSVWAPSAAADFPAEPTSLTLQNLSVPPGHGSIKETWDSGKQGPFIVNVQDAFASYPAQKHLAAILDHLIRQHGLYLVLVEGGTRNDSISYLRSHAPLEKRLQVAEEFLRSGKISGENYLDLTTDHNFLVYGVEKPELYDQGMEVYSETRRLQPEALTALQGFQQAVAALKKQLYPQEVKDLENQEQEVDANRAPLTTYYETLMEAAKKRGVSTEERDYPNFWNFLKAARLEKELDFKQARASLEKLDSELGNTAPDTFLQQCLNLQNGGITPGVLYRNLRARVKPERLAEDSLVLKYMDYLRSFDGINHAALFIEAENLSDRIKGSYLKTQEENQIALLSKDFGICKELLDMKLTPETYDYYLTHKSEFNPDEWAHLLQTIGSQQNPALGFVLDLNPLNRSIPAMAKFYEIVRQRSRAMIENGLKRVDESHVPFAVLISGGFHTPELTRFFKEQQISYAVIAPKVGRITPADTAKYHRVLTETYVPMSKEARKKLEGQPAVAASMNDE